MSNGNSERETFGDTEEGNPPSEESTVSTAPTGAANVTDALRELDSGDDRTGARTLVAERSAQSTSVKVLWVTPIPSPTPDNPGRTYYTLAAANAEPRNERDSASLEFQHLSLDDDLIHAGDSLGIYVSNEEPPAEMLIPDDSILRPFSVVCLPGNTEGDLWFFTVTFYDVRTEEWADGYIESGQLTIGTREEDALALGGYVVIRWNGVF